MNLWVEVGCQVVIIKFYVVEKLRAGDILGRGFRDRYVETIRPSRKVVELNNRSTVHITRDAINRNKTNIPLPAGQIHAKQTRRSAVWILVSRKARLEPKSQTWVNVKTSQDGLIVVEPLPRPYDWHNCPAAAAFYQDTPAEDFYRFMDNFSLKPVYITECQAVAKSAEHPTLSP